VYARRALKRFLHRHGLEDRIHVVVDGCPLAAIWQYVSLGIGITLSYAATFLLQPFPKIHLCRFNLGVPNLRVALVLRKGAHLSPSAAEFCKLVRKQAAELGPPSGD
jgi:DNA-binding transcriptional LysR family regulator